MALKETLKTIERLAVCCQIDLAAKNYSALEEDLKLLNEYFGNLGVDLMMEEMGHLKHRESRRAKP